MKKKVITLLLSLVLASGGAGHVQVLAAETTGQEAEPVQEEAYEREEEPVQEEANEQEEEPVLEEKPAEEADVENAAEDVSGPEKEIVSVPENEEQIRRIEGSESEEAPDEEEFDTSVEAAAEVLETEENEVTDESEDALTGIVDSGSCGNNAAWALTGTENDLTLTISGSGNMTDFSESSTPWASERAKITRVVVEDGITSVGSYAFCSFSKLTDVSLSDSITYIGARGFEKCTALKSVTIPDCVTTIGEGAFDGCDSLKSLTIPDSVTSIDWAAFPRTYWKTNDFVIFTQSPYVKNYCYLNYYAYFDKTAPSIAKLTSYNGSDIRVYFEKRDEAFVSDHLFGNGCVSGYQIKYADNKNMTGARSIMLTDKKAAWKVITGLKNGKTYYVQIQHYLKSGNVSYWSKWSPAATVSVGQTPYNTNVSKLSTFIGSHIKVDWTKTAGASGYHIKYVDNSSMTGAKEVFVKGNSTFTKTLTGLKYGNTYYVKIQTYRTVSGKTYWSPWSPAKSIMVDQTPYGSSISKLTNPSGKAMKITWDKAPSASGYHIQYAANSSMTGKKDITINNKDTLSKTVTGLTKGKTYYVRIQTFRKVSGKTYWSSWSKAKQIKISK